MSEAYLMKKSSHIRKQTLTSIATLGIGHLGGSLSIVDILVVLYYGIMNIDPSNPKMEGRDRFVLSKGHAGPALYAVLADKGFFSSDHLATLNLLGTSLPSHCDMALTPGIDMTTGSLGQGLSCAVGIAIGAKIKKERSRVYAIIGDGESQEGQIWEAAMFASQKKLENLIVFCDNNKLQVDGYVDQINTLGDLSAKWTAFGWDTQIIDGHNHRMILQAIEKAQMDGDRPHMIISNTIKGKGIDFCEQAAAGNHNMPVTKDDYMQALATLELE